MAEIVQGNPVNNPTVKTVNTHSHCEIPYNFFNTYRFGYIAPHFWFDSVPNDKNTSLRCSHDIRSYTMKSPLMQSVKMRKEYFQVYMDSILPMNWDKIYTNPSIGDDVNASLVGCTIPNFLSTIYPVFNAIYSNFSNSTSSTGRLTHALFYLILGELFFSNGCLLANLGVHLNRRFAFVPVSGSQLDYMRFDDYFDSCISYINSNVKSITCSVDGVTYHVVTGLYDKSVLSPYKVINLRELLELIRQDLTTLAISSVVFKSSSADDFLLSQDGTPTIYTSGDIPLNLNKVLSYQLVCFHFFTNDKVDYIYSAELYREYIHYLIGLCSVADATFSYNGMSLPYDYLSSYYFGQVLSGSVSNAYKASYLLAIFQFRESLRFVDYFTGSRTRPLAVGDVNVNVSNNKVSVIDVTQKIQAQRFLNAVNRFGRQMSEYIKGLFPGASQRSDYHDPFWIGSTEDVVHAVETENTSALQFSMANSVTSLMRSNASRYAFEINSVDRPCVILGLTYFDVSRAYFRSIERQNFHTDRYDMFNPFLQFVGDQKVYLAEMNNSDQITIGAFGYQTRYMEYKQRYHQAAGGFVDSLPGYAFLENQDPFEELPMNAISRPLDPNFIRSHSWEFDPFFVTLSGWSLGHYFHFIVVNSNDCSSDRPMAYSPSIL